MMKKIFLLILCAFAFGGSSGVSAAASQKPNVLILYADDLGYGDLGCYNPDSKIPTPHLDKLAEQGMRFTDAHSSSGICTPSRYALLTGRYHWRKFHDIVSTFGESVFDPDRLTLPEMLQKNGYTTALIGKWHLGWDWSSIRREDSEIAGMDGRDPIWGPEDYDWSQPIEDGPLAHGFDYYFGDTVINFPPYCWIENDRVVEAPDRMMDPDAFRPVKEGRINYRPGPMITGWDPYENIPTTTRKGVEKIHEMAGAGRPFFLFFSYPSPHAPIVPNDEFDGKSDAGPYGDHVFETDDSCGQLLDALEEAGVAGNTIVIFTADNGPEWFAFDRDQTVGHWSSHPLRGLKRDIYEGGHRVPFIVRWPGVVPEGSVSHALTSQIDLMATLAAVLEVELARDQAEDSFNQLPVWTGDRFNVRDTLIHNTFEDQYAIRKGNWVLIDRESGYWRKRPQVAEWEAARNYPPDDDLPFELYYLGNDLEQRHNIAGENPERVSALKERLRRIRKQGFSAPHASPSQL